MRNILTSVFLFFLINFFAAGIVFAKVETNRDYKGVTNFIHALAVQHPQTTEVIHIGFSDQGVAIEGLKIGSGSIKNLLVATHHGNEYGSAEVALHFAESLAAAPIPGQTMFVIPVLNIDGYNYRNRYERVNGRNIDQNRDYPSPCGSEGPFYSRSTKALADFIEQNDIIVSSTIHTYWPAVVYPWGISTRDTETPYTSQFEKLAQAATSTSRYRYGNNTELIYPADGAFEDYAYWKHGVWSMLFEIGRSHSPSLRDLEEMVRVNIPGLRKMYENAPVARAEKHDFAGRCDFALRALDLHIE